MLLKKLTAIVLIAYLFLLLVFTLVASHYLSIPPSIANLPDFSAIEDTKARKSTFFSYFGAIIEAKNSQLSTKREALLLIQEQWQEHGQLNGKNRKRLRQLSASFGVEATDPAQAIKELLLRVDIIPASMVLAQAANESGWGRSRFAQQGYNYFGQWCFTKGCGIVPNKRAAHAGHEVRVFRSPAESVAAYFKNINTHRAYREVRQIRESLRTQQQPLRGSALVAGLGQYSERGKAYIEELRAMIRANKLE
ncbi:glucosaminidase domain-containing protein [Teredinibacter franksiae]|uniref:glucosaminidase domain-containing protein n=1 Tax=Teredinibacter franksiae TaxID=2761453 RepID=UPI001FE83AB7|nr:glucosaminidase domain-containing protein [Teredinibacter franksiae]